MKTIPAAQLKEGQRYSEPVYIGNDYLWLPADVPVKKRDLELLVTLGFDAVATNGRLLQDNADVASEADALGAGSVETEGSGNTDGVYRKINSIIKQLDAIFSEVREGRMAERSKRNVSVRQLWTIASKLLVLVRDEKKACLAFILCGSVVEGAGLAKSSVNTTILSILISRELSVHSQLVPPITVGALLHDVGMLRLPSGVVEKQTRLTEEEAKIVRGHPLLSYQIMTKEFACPENIATVALQHHERWDGTGYPHRLVGSAIGVGARIVSVADAFEAMVCKKPYRNSMIGYTAMKNLVSENAAHFAPPMLKAFVKIMGVYPIGSGVMLNDGQIAQIVAVRPDAPLRPKVRIIAESEAKPVFNGEVIDLMTSKKFFVTQAFDISGFSVQPF